MVHNGCEVVARSAATVASIFGRKFVNGEVKAPRPQERPEWETKELLKSPEGARREAELRNQANARYFLRATAETEQYPFAS